MIGFLVAARLAAEAVARVADDQRKRLGLPPPPPPTWKQRMEYRFGTFLFWFLILSPVIPFTLAFVLWFRVAWALSEK